VFDSFRTRWHGSNKEDAQMPEMNKKGEERAYGVYRATVTDEDDPVGSARVKVRPANAALPEAWARVATWHLPATGEAVVVAYEGGDPREPYVVGSLWGEAGEPPTASRVGSARYERQRHLARTSRSHDHRTREAFVCGRKRRDICRLAHYRRRHVTLQRSRTSGHRDHEQRRRVELHAGRREHLVTHAPLASKHQGI
jgi:uncharacterized protein involved in type VI secretion and phage assembly